MTTAQAKADKTATPTAPSFTADQSAAMAQHTVAFEAWKAADSERASRTVDVANATALLADQKVIPALGGKRGEAAYTMADYASTIGTSESNLIQWRNLGMALRAGVEPNGDTWSALYNSGAKVNSKAVTEVLKGKSPSAAKIAAAIKPAKAASAGNGNTSGTRMSPARKAKADLATALDILARCLPNLTPGEFAKVPDALAKVVKAATDERKGSKGTARKAA